MAFHTKKDEERFNNAAETRRNRPQWKVKLANELLTQKKKIMKKEEAKIKQVKKEAKKESGYHKN